MVSKLSIDSFEAQLKLVSSSGKFQCGIKAARKSLEKNNAKLILIASNTPRTETFEIEYKCMLTNTQILKFNGTSIDLGNALGKKFPAYAVVIHNLGESNLLDRLKK